MCSDDDCQGHSTFEAQIAQAIGLSLRESTAWSSASPTSASNNNATSTAHVTTIDVSAEASPTATPNAQAQPKEKRKSSKSVGRKKAKAEATRKKRDKAKAVEDAQKKDNTTSTLPKRSRRIDELDIYADGSHNNTLPPPAQKKNDVLPSLPKRSRRIDEFDIFSDGSHNNSCHPSAQKNNDATSSLPQSNVAVVAAATCSPSSTIPNQRNDATAITPSTALHHSRRTPEPRLKRKSASSDCIIMGQSTKRHMANSHAPPIVTDATYHNKTVDLTAPEHIHPLNKEAWYHTKPDRFGETKDRRSGHEHDAKFNIRDVANKALNRQKAKLKDLYKNSGNKEQRRSLLVKFCADEEKLTDNTGEEFTVADEARSIGIVNNEEMEVAMHMMENVRNLLGKARQTNNSNGTNTTIKNITVQAISTAVSKTPEKDPTRKQKNRVARSKIRKFLGFSHGAGHRNLKKG